MYYEIYVILYSSILILQGNMTHIDTASRTHVTDNTDYSVIICIELIAIVQHAKFVQTMDDG